MAQIDIEHAKKEFDKYLRDFDLGNPKILLKKVHTYGVVKAADYICTREELKPEDRDLALLIALLHDIGRFEQLKAYNIMMITALIMPDSGLSSFLKRERSKTLFPAETMMK